MDVQSSSQKKITRIHTFESDVAQARMAQGIETPAVTPVAVAKTVSTEKKSTYVPHATVEQKPIMPIPNVAVAQPEVTARVSTPVTPTAVVQVPQTPLVQKAPVFTAPIETSKKPITTKTYSAISKEIAGAALTQTHAPSILSDTTDAYDGNALGGGTIISDTKRKRFKLFPAMLSAITSWFSNANEAYRESRAPIHTVAKAEKRIETIVKAASQSEQAPKDDSKKLAELLKTVERTPVTSTLTFKDKESVPQPTWESARAVQNTPEEKPPAIHEPLRKPEVVAEIIEPVVAPIATPLEPEIEVIPEPADPVVFEQSQYEAKTEPEQVFVEPTVEVAPLPPTQYVEEKTAEPVTQQTLQTQRYAPPRTDKSSLPFYALISVILIASFSGIAFSYYLFAGKSSSVTQVQAPVYEVPKLIQAQDSTSFALTGDRNELLQTLLSKLETANTVTQMYPTVAEEGGISKPAPAEAIVAVLAPRAPGSFTRSIKEITFGSSATAEPFIIIKSTSFDVAFAGMLNWEKTMSADLMPLFGETVTETFDPQARTATGAREAFFKDVIASNKNARVLLDENGDDRIVYTFTDQNTILITTNRETLAELISLVK